MNQTEPDIVQLYMALATGDDEFIILANDAISDSSLHIGRAIYSQVFPPNANAFAHVELSKNNMKDAGRLTHFQASIFELIAQKISCTEVAIHYFADCSQGKLALENARINLENARQNLMDAFVLLPLNASPSIKDKYENVLTACNRYSNQIREIIDR